MLGIYYPAAGANNPPGMQIVSGATSVPRSAITITLDSLPSVLVIANEAGLWQTSFMGVGIGTHTITVAAPTGETVTRQFSVGAASATTPRANTPIPPPPHASAGMSAGAQVGMVAVAAAAVWWFFIRPGR